MEAEKLNAWRYRSRRYHPTHLRANTRISDINPPATPSVAPSNVDKAMRVPKERPRKLLRLIGGEGTGAVQATDVARIRALRDFLSKGEAD